MSTRPNRVFELTRAIVRWAYRNKLIPANPMEMLTRPKKKERARERDLSVTEIALFWRNIELLPALALSKKYYASCGNWPVDRIASSLRPQASKAVRFSASKLYFM